MKARVLEPLGMTRTTFRPTEAMTWPLAIGHRRDQAGAFSAVRPLPNDARCGRRARSIRARRRWRAWSLRC